MSTDTYHRLLRENGGNMHNALLHAAATIDYLADRVSAGLVRVNPYQTTRPPKPVVVALDVPKDESPHG